MVTRKLKSGLAGVLCLLLFGCCLMVSSAWGVRNLISCVFSEPFLGYVPLFLVFSHICSCFWMSWSLMPGSQKGKREKMVRVNKHYLWSPLEIHFSGWGVVAAVATCLTGCISATRCGISAQVPGAQGPFVHPGSHRQLQKHVWPLELATFTSSRFQISCIRWICPWGCCPGGGSFLVLPASWSS